MKKYIFLLIISVFSIQAYAQKTSKHDQIKSLKIAYFTEHLNLSSEEAEKFWPIYNAHENKMHEIKFSEYKKLKPQLRGEGFENLSDADAKVILKKLEAIETNEYELNRKYTKDLEKVISAKKIILLKKLEDDFNRKLLDRLRKEYHRKND
ncbi:hypothetical protein [Joostella sp. CR20]|uniref:hypothetical protein n=1 Tax=Joostella sp. CR20 TaxID=2804312 RepID=UPI00313CF4AB